MSPLAAQRNGANELVGADDAYIPSSAPPVCELCFISGMYNRQSDSVPAQTCTNVLSARVG